VQQMDEVTQSNAALVEEAAAAADTVQMRARLLVESVEFFKLGEDAKRATKPDLKQVPQTSVVKASATQQLAAA
jgi:hypothetical protein